MHPVLTIAKKRDKQTLTDAEIHAFIQGFATGHIHDYQMSALAMAIYLNGMDAAETSALTNEMLRSGIQLLWSDNSVPKVDKHSTGGIGDKVSLILAPLLACCGLQVPMLSGRGLGATGGTLDKLEAIPGYRTNLTVDEIRDVTERVGCVITGTTSDLAPADRKLYALRDVTGTVASIPLITASIMSKKLAENLDALVLDVKYGSGAFMKSYEDAEQLAESLVDTGRHMGVKTSALLTDMNQPLGRMVGNALEVNESIAALRGAGPEDLWRVTCDLGVELLLLTEFADSATAAEEMLNEHISSGRAFEKFREMVTAQGGDLEVHRAVAAAWEWESPTEGFITAMDAEKIGIAVIELGGGRKVMTDHVDHSVGFEMLVRIGDHVKRGQPLVRVFGPSATKPNAALVRDNVQSLLAHSMTISDHQVVPRPHYLRTSRLKSKK